MRLGRSSKMAFWPILLAHPALTTLIRLRVIAMRYSITDLSGCEVRRSLPRLIILSVFNRMRALAEFEPYRFHNPSKRLPAMRV
jgi:hypothetical protein